MKKGFGTAPDGSIELISKNIEKCLKIPCNVLMGANLANEVAEEHFCETTIGKVSKNYKRRIQKYHFFITKTYKSNIFRMQG